MTRKEALKYVNNMYMYEDTKNALETLIPEFGKTCSDKAIDYEEKYNEALERSRRLHDRMLVLSSTDALVASAELEFIFPELAESEDERIRKWLIDYFKEVGKSWIHRDISPEQILAYLEKQEIFSKGEGLYYYHPDGNYTFIGTGLGPVEDITLNGERPKTKNKGVDLSGYVKINGCVEKQKEPHKRLRDKTPWIVTAKEELAHAEERLQANLEELHRIRAEKEKQKDLTTENIYKHSRERMSFYNGQQKEQNPISFNVPFNPDDYEVVMQGNATGLKLKENPKSADSIPSDCTSDAKCGDRWHKVGDSLPDNPREVLCKDEAGNYFIGRYYTGEGWEISNYDDEDKPHHLNPPVSKWIDFPSEKKKEQKPLRNLEIPAENESVAETADSELEKELNTFLCGYDREINEEEIATLTNVAEHFYQLGKQEQKPVEWSEEDKEMLLSIINAFRNGTVSTIGQEQWLKALPERFNLQPKQEWSDEDKRMIDDIISALPKMAEAEDNILPAILPSVARKYAERLKSLRPQYHGDVTMTEAYKMGLEAGKASSWKPSEEQMEALEAATVRYQSTGLESLYEDLKKL